MNIKELAKLYYQDLTDLGTILGNYSCETVKDPYGTGDYSYSELEIHGDVEFKISKKEIIRTLVADTNLTIVEKLQVFAELKDYSFITVEVEHEGTTIETQATIVWVD